MHKFFLASLLLVSQVAVASDAGYKPEALVISDDELTENSLARLCCEIASECCAICLLGPVIVVCCRQQAEPWGQNTVEPNSIRQEKQRRTETPERTRILRNQKSKMQ